MAEVVRTAPAEFIEAGAKTYLDDLTKAIGDFKTTDLSTIMGPQFVAGPGALTTQAETLASGLGGFQPFLTQAQQLRGPTAYQAYMSPYQQDVIDTTLAEFDRQTQKGLPALSAQAIGCRSVWWWYERVLKEQSFKQHLIETEQHYKHSYYNKVLVKHKI